VISCSWLNFELILHRERCGALLRLGGRGRPSPHESWPYRSAFLRRRELVITETELKLMAVAARIGLSSHPKIG
jgi:hypothetical protein